MPKSKVNNPTKPLHQFCTRCHTAPGTILSPHISWRSHGKKLVCQDCDEELMRLAQEGRENRDRPKEPDDGLGGG